MTDKPIIHVRVGDNVIVFDLNEPIPAPSPAWRTGFDGIDRFLNEADTRRMLMEEHLPLVRANLREELRLAALHQPNANVAEALHNRWHESHHFFRAVIDDDDLLMDFAWVWLPRYQGPAMTLHRGENIGRLKEGRIGSAWSDKPETALMFARGLNAVGTGGVHLRADVPASAIIAGPSKHSLYLGESEFTVDFRRLRGYEKVNFFPAVS
jgi:hypothetical protein